MLNVGIIGLGSMGMTHLAAHLKEAHARVVAVSDLKFATPGAKIGRVGNIPGHTDDIGPALDEIIKYSNAADLLANPDIQAVDICAPTSEHKNLALAAIRAGKHVLVEKPLARTSADAREIAAAARTANLVLMPAHCMRFWPGWDWLKEAVDSRRFGAVESAVFTRVGGKPPVPFYNDGVACGGAHFDLHIHDTDFVAHLFGKPAAVSSFGRIGESGAVEHTFTHYHFSGENTHALVTAEGAWTRDSEKRPFTMRYAVSFEHASAVFDLTAPDPLLLYRPGQATEAIPLQPGIGYAYEIAEFIRCATAGTNSRFVNGDDGVLVLEIIEAESRSIETGKTVFL
jgi:predicted dehydrogenase